jgi:hypothetical protein
VNFYYRSQYGPQPLVHGLMNKRQILTYALVTDLLALAAGLVHNRRIGFQIKIGLGKEYL